MCAIKFWLAPGFSPKNKYFQNFFSIEMKIKLKSTEYFFQSLLLDLEIAIEIRQVHKRFIKLTITLLFWHDVL